MNEPQSPRTFTVRWTGQIRAATADEAARMARAFVNQQTQFDVLDWNDVDAGWQRIDVDRARERRP